MEFYPVDFVFHIINIVVLFVLVRALAYKPVRKFMLAREERVAAQLAGAEQAKAEAEALKARYESDVAGAEKEKSEIVAKGYDEAAAEREKLLADAKAEAAKILAEAGERAEALRAQALDSAKGDLADIAVELAGKVLCFDEAARSRAMAMNTALSGAAAASVKTAGDCTPDELSEIRSCLENLTGKHLTLTVDRDSSLLGGFVAYIEGQVYDFSYSAQLAALQRSLG